MCLYQIEPDVGLGFAHAYFPAAMFDEWHIRGGWAFARVGDGYIALWGDGDLILLDDGQQLRSSGAGVAWMCHVGTGGNFAEFMATMTDPHSDGTQLAWTAPNGEALAFGWDAPFRVNGRPQKWDDFPHYENAFTHTPLDSTQMDIHHRGDSLLLDWSPFML
jgi:hypothetical protein